MDRKNTPVGVLTGHGAFLGSMLIATYMAGQNLEPLSSWWVDIPKTRGIGSLDRRSTKVIWCLTATYMTDLVELTLNLLAHFSGDRWLDPPWHPHTPCPSSKRRGAAPRVCKLVEIGRTIFLARQWPVDVQSHSPQAPGHQVFSIFVVG